MTLAHTYDITLTHTYDIEIASYNSRVIQVVAKELGITHMRMLGYGKGVTFFALPSPSGWEFEVADTEGDPAWADEDPKAYEQLKAECLGIESGEGEQQ